MLQTINLEPILDDDGVRRLLKLPDDHDLQYLRKREHLPYVMLKVDSKPIYRYVQEEVLRWMIARQHHGMAEREAAGRMEL